MNNYLIYNHSYDFFYNTGDELFKLAIALSNSLKSNKILLFDDENFIRIFETQLQIPYKLINNEELIDYNPLYLNIYIDYNENLITKESLIYLSNIMSNNRDFINEVYKKINEIMNYYHDYEIDNYVCIIINKKNYNPYSYEENLSKYNEKHKIIISDDCNWCNNYIPYIYNPFFIDKNEKPLIYLYMISIFNIIIGNKFDNYTLMSYLLNKNSKKIINFL